MQSIYDRDIAIYKNMGQPKKGFCEESRLITMGMLEMPKLERLVK